MSDTILTYLTYALPGTIEMLAEKYPAPNSIIDSVSNRVFSRYFPADVSESDLDDRTRAYIADVIAVELIPSAIDVYMNEARLSDTSNGEVTQYYDKVKTLQTTKGIIERRIADNTSAFDKTNTKTIVDTVKVTMVPMGGAASLDGFSTMATNTTSFGRSYE